MNLGVDYMAVLKQNEVKTIRKVKKETTLPQDVWAMVTSYIKYAGIKGSQVDKRNFVIEGALKHLFENDKEFQIYLGKDEEAPAKEEVAAKETAAKVLGNTQVKNK